ncbi:hypothetical protein JB92DRAFT_890546 [Gautieria morchelliformis]|nr:hypothetical protein JB92DRAFT_890546 [Gautieria morchelliformis]
MQANCVTPHCGCTVPFLRAQGNCLVCQTNTPQDAATVQLLLDVETNQCRSEGIKVDFQLYLKPAAAAIIQKYRRDSASLQRSQTVFLALQIAGGHIGMVALLVFAVFSRKVDRDPTFLNFCLTWIFSSIVFSILLYRGTDGNTVVNSLGIVPSSICVLQAALTQGVQVMTAGSTLALVVQLWLSLRASIRGDSIKDIKQARWMTYALLLMPYILFMVFTLPSIVPGMGTVVVNGSLAQRSIPTNFYCAMILLNPLIRAVSGTTLALLIIAMVFDVLIIRMLYRHWKVFRHSSPGWQTNGVVPLSILLRVILFSVVFALPAHSAHGASTLVSPWGPAAGEGASSIELGGLTFVDFGVPIWVDILQAATPLVGFLVLGVNRDTISFFMFWRRPRTGGST